MIREHYRYFAGKLEGTARKVLPVIVGLALRGIIGLATIGGVGSYLLNQRTISNDIIWAMEQSSLYPEFAPKIQEHINNCENNPRWYDPRLLIPGTARFLLPPRPDFEAKRQELIEQGFYNRD